MSAGRAVYVDCGADMYALYQAHFEDRIPDLTVHRGDPDLVTLERLVADAEIVVDGHTRLDAPLLAKARRLRHVVFLGTGADFYVAPEDAATAGVVVHTIRGYGDRAVAEHSIALAFAAARHVASMDAEMRAGRWTQRPGIELAGRCFGIVGTGGIGRTTAALAAAIGMDVRTWNRSGVPADVAGRSCASVEALMEASDVVSLHLAATPMTTGFIGRGRLAHMRPGAILINTARGALVDEIALLEALDGEHLACAALDVFGEEPLSTDHPLRRHPRVVLTPHVAYNTYEAKFRLLDSGLAITRDLLACR